MAVVEGTFTWRPVAQTAKVVPVGAQRERNDSAVLLGDGRVLYVYNDGGAVWQGYAPSVAAFISVNGSVVNRTLALAVGTASPCISQVGDDLFMAVMHAAGTKFMVELYKSPSGIGGDWTLFSTLQDHTDSPWSSWNAYDVRARFCGEIFVTATGRWVLPAGHFRNYGGPNYGAVVIPAVWTSDNAGVTWTARTFFASLASSGIGTQGINRNIAFFDGALWTSMESTHVANVGRVQKSTDGGTTWVTALSASVRTSEACFGVVDDTSLYVTHRNGAGHGGIVEQVTQMEPFFTNWTQIRDYSSTGFGGQPIVQRLGDEIVYIHNGTVLGIQTPRSGWVIGRVPLA